MSFLSPHCTREILWKSSQRCSLPLFLTPAFSTSRAQCFSTTIPAHSRIGGAPISVPLEVSLNLVDLPEASVRTRGKDIPKFAAHIKGPKGVFCTADRDCVSRLVNISRCIVGEMSLNIPSFLTVSKDEANHKITLSVLDSEVPHQRAMWGMFTLFSCRILLFHADTK